MHPASSASSYCADSLLTLHAVEHRGRRAPLKHRKSTSPLWWWSTADVHAGSACIHLFPYLQV